MTIASGFHGSTTVYHVDFQSFVVHSDDNSSGSGAMRDTAERLATAKDTTAFAEAIADRPSLCTREGHRLRSYGSKWYVVNEP